MPASLYCPLKLRENPNNPEACAEWEAVKKKEVGSRASQPVGSPSKSGWRWGKGVTPLGCRNTVPSSSIGGSWKQLRTPASSWYNYPFPSPPPTLLSLPNTPWPSLTSSTESWRKVKKKPFPPLFCFWKALNDFAQEARKKGRSEKKSKIDLLGSLSLSKIILWKFSRRSTIIKMLLAVFDQMKQGEREREHWCHFPHLPWNEEDLFFSFFFSERQGCCQEAMTIRKDAADIISLFFFWPFLFCCYITTTMWYSSTYVGTAELQFASKVSGQQLKLKLYYNIMEVVIRWSKFGNLLVLSLHAVPTVPIW